MLLDQAELASLIDYLKTHYNKVENNLFFEDENGIPFGPF